MSELYKDATKPIEERVDDLMSRMTVEEKVGQIVQIDGHTNCLQELRRQHAGSVLNLMGDDVKPVMDEVKKTRLQIPVLMGIDATHGYSFWEGSTIFPTQLGIAQSWDESIIRKMAEVTANEMRYTGVHLNFAPIVCIARDPRWGRVGETFGEDPYLIGKFASAIIKGFQGEKISDDQDHLLATAKHFAGYSETQGGRDASEADITHRKLLSYFLPQFKKCAEAGVGAFMTGYQSMDGIPTTMNKWLLRDVLKNDWKYEGFLVTDWNNVGWLVEDQKVCATYEEAATVAVKCGNYMMMNTPAFFDGCLEALKSGKLDIKDIEEPCRKILRTKFELGLFEDPRYPDVEKNKSRLNTSEHRQCALDAALESLVLLKNDGILPLKEGANVGLIGPNADHVLAQLGDWSLGSCPQEILKNKRHPRNCTVTIKDAFKQRYGDKLKYSAGANIEEGDESFNEVETNNIIKSSDFIIVVVGDRNTHWGEYKCTATLKLQGTQRELINKVADSGKPCIVAVISSKPLVLPKRAFKANAITWQFSPGMLGGEAFYRIVFGQNSPRGRLTISIPYHVGQLPIFYNQIRGQHGDKYADMTQRPRFEFGYGLTYTSFEYVSAKLDKEVYNVNDKIVAKVQVKNTGNVSGFEVVQLYIHDVVTSCTWAIKELKGYTTAEIAPGETKEVTIEIPASECSIVNTNCERVVEKGEFKALIGASSLNIKHELCFRIE